MAALSTKEYMAQHMNKFNEPYERAKRLQTEHAVLDDGAGGALAAKRYLEPDRIRTALNGRLCVDLVGTP